MVFPFLQAFIDAWEMACSFPLRTRLVIPAGSTYLVYPVNLGGPCRSKVTLRVGTNISPLGWQYLFHNVSFSFFIFFPELSIVLSVY